MANWPHAPTHQLTEAGAYMVTCGTYRKLHHFHDAERRRTLHDLLLALAGEFCWQLEAWAVFANHYHFVAQSPDDPATLRAFLAALHTATSTLANRLDGTPGRQVWFNYRDTHLTYERSYLARLQYVHTNAVHHGLVQTATAYPWCSAAWFERTATPAFQRTLATFKLDRVNVPDDYDLR